MFQWTGTALKICDGSAWQTLSVGDPNCSAGAIGTICTDGTLYAGLSPDGNVPMYAAPCDLGMSGTKGNCSGARSYLEWGTYGKITGYSDHTTGKANSAALIANYGTYLDTQGITGVPPEQGCAALGYGGRSDWYVPSINEIAVLYANRVALGNTFDTSGNLYWTSAENGGNVACGYRFSNGLWSCAFQKYGTSAVRCIRK